jgi:hypothetical protein
VARATAAGAQLHIGDATAVPIDAIGSAVRDRRRVGAAVFHADGLSLPVSELLVDETVADQRIGRAGKLGSDAFRECVLELDYGSCRLRLERTRQG